MEAIVISEAASDWASGRVYSVVPMTTYGPSAALVAGSIDMQSWAEIPSVNGSGSLR